MREYKLYNLAIYKTEKGLMGVQGYVNDKSLSEKHYNIEEDTGRTTRAGKPIIKGQIFFETENGYPDGYVEDPKREWNEKIVYEVVVEEDDNNKRRIKTCVLSKEVTDIFNGKLSPVRRTKPDEKGNTKPYVFLSFEIAEATLDGAPNKEDLINFLKTRGMTQNATPYQGNYQFSAFYSLYENQIPTFSPLAHKHQYFLATFTTKNGKTYVTNIFPNNVFEKDIQLKGFVTEIKDDVVIIEKEASYEQLKEEESLNLPYLANAVEYLESGDRKMTFNVKVATCNVKVGDQVNISLNEGNFSKIMNAKINLEELNAISNDKPEPKVKEEDSNNQSNEEYADYEWEGEEAPKEEAPKEEAPKEEAPKEEAPTTKIPF